MHCMDDTSASPPSSERPKRSGHQCVAGIDSPLNDDQMNGRSRPALSVYTIHLVSQCGGQQDEPSTGHAGDVTCRMSSAPGSNISQHSTRRKMTCLTNRIVTHSASRRYRIRYDTIRDAILTCARKPTESA